MLYAHLLKRGLCIAAWFTLPVLLTWLQSWGLAAPDPEAFKTLLQKMGVALTDDQFTKFQELVEQSKEELVHKKRKTEVEAPPGLASQTGKEERSRSRTPPK